MKPWLFFCLACTLGGARNLKGQPILFQYTYAQSQTLPFPMSGFDMVQDRAGFIYWSHVDGVFRFDGFRTKLYKVNNSSKGGPQVQFSYSLFCDKSDRIWVGMRNGLALLNRDSENLQLICALPEKTSDFSFPLLEDGQGNILFDSYDNTPEHGNFSKYNPTTGKISSYQIYMPDGTMLKEEIMNLYIDKLGVRFISRSGSFLLKIENDGSAAAQPLDRPVGTAGAILFNILAVDSTGYYWAIDRSGVLYRGPDMNHLMPFKNIPEVCKWRNVQVTIDRKNRAWIAGPRIAIFQIDFGKWQFIDPKTCENDGFAGDKIFFIFHDRRNVHWVMSGRRNSGGEIHILTEFPEIVKYWPAPTGPDRFVFPMYRDPENGEIWVGLYQGGVYRLDANLNTITHLDVGTLLTDRVIYMAPAGKNEIWFNCVPKGISIFNKRTGIVRPFIPPEGRAYQEVFLLEDGQLFLAAFNHTAIYDPRTGRLRENQAIYLKNEADATFRFVQCLEQEGDTLWVGGYDKKIHLISLKNGAVQTLNTRFINHNIMDLHRRGDLLYIGTMGEGLIEYDLKKHSVRRQFMTPEGFPHHTVYRIEEDRQGRLWLLSSNGLTLYEPEISKFTEFRTIDGLPFEGGTSGGMYQDDLGRMYVGFPGFYYFDPDSLLLNRPDYPCNVAISSVHVNGKPFIYPAENGLQLAPDENFLEIYFSNLDFGYPEMDTFWYKLDGVDADWRPLDEPRLVLARIPPGNYILNIRCTNRFGIRSNLTGRFPIIIKPWWWQRWETTVGLLLLIAVLLYMLITRFTLKKRLQEKDLRVQMQRKSMEALRSQLNHHFIKNAIGRSNAKVLSDDMEEANRFLGSLASLLEIMMLSTKKDFYRLSDEIEIIRSYLNIQRERWNKIFAFELQVEPQLHLHEIFIPSLLTQPVVENAVEHGALSKKDGSGKIRITWSLNGQNLLCAIEDNGKNGSILPASRHHNGLENVRTRIQILNNLYRTAISLQIKINKEGGVCAIFSFPLIQTEPDEYSEL